MTVTTDVHWALTVGLNSMKLPLLDHISSTKMAIAYGSIQPRRALSVLLQSAQHSIDIVIIIIISFYRGESWNTKKWRHAFLNLLQNQQVPKDARADAQEQGDTPLESSDAGGTQIQGKGWQRKSQPSKERGVLSEQQKDTKTCWCLLLEEGATEDHFDMVSFSFCSGWRRKWAKSLPGRQVLASHAEQQRGWKPGERKSSERMTEWERVNMGK